MYSDYMEIVPAFLEQDFETIIQKIRPFHSITPLVQIDICDGRFVPTRTWPYSTSDIVFATQNVELEKLKALGLPFELDLMIQNPEQVLGKWLLTKPVRAVIHWGSSRDLNMVFAILRGYQMDNPKFTFGLAVPANITVMDIAKYVRYISFIQVMGIDRVGAQGQPFSKTALVTIPLLRKEFPNIPLHVDGGVSVQNIVLLGELGVSVVAVGSTIQNAPDPIAAYQNISTLIGSDM